MWRALRTAKLLGVSSLSREIERGFCYEKSQDIFNLLDTFNLSDDERDFISQCDQYAIVDLFGTVKSEKEAKEIIKEYSE